MTKTLNIKVDVADGEDVLLVAMLSTGLSLSVAMKHEKAIFGQILQLPSIGPAGDRPVSIRYTEAADANAQAPGPIPGLAGQGPGSEVDGNQEGPIRDGGGDSGREAAPRDEAPIDWSEGRGELA